MAALPFDQYDMLRVRYRPRAEYRGRPLLLQLEQFAGHELDVQVLWWMDDDDPYPGEAALGRPMDDAAGDRDVFGRLPSGDPLLARGTWTLWIASGDCEVLEVRPWRWAGTLAKGG